MPALDKALDVIEWLATSSIPKSQTELAVALKRTPSKIFRTLVALEERGYIVKDPISGKYHLSLKLYTIAHSHSPVDYLTRAARIPMQKLSERTLQSCHLGVLHGENLLIIAGEMAPTPLRMSVEVGSLHPIQTATSGRLLAALLPEEDFQMRYGKPVPDAKEIRKRGWIDEPSLTVRGVRNIAVPVRIPGGYAALTIPWIGLTERGDMGQSLLKACQQAAEEISAALHTE